MVPQRHDASLSQTSESNVCATPSYDEFNRLSTSAMPPTNSTLAYSYDYDQYGNRWHQTVTKGTGWNMVLSFDSNNHIRTASYGYDAAGNLMRDTVNCYTYDAENRLASVAPISPPGTGNCGAATMNYVYDADGQRVARVVNGTVTEHDYYDAEGQEIAVTNGSGTLQRAEIYAGSRHLATWNNGATYFNHADWLGTERVRTFASGQYAGQACETVTSLPFGDGMATQPLNGGCGDPSPDHFTGKERDAESGLDNFGGRYNSSSIGRFMTPDSAPDAADPSAPQTWNKYPYATNNPTTLIDPNGNDAYVCLNNENGGQDCAWYSDEDYAKYAAAQNAAGQGISAPVANDQNGGHPSGDITCGGAVCGTVTYGEAPSSRPDLDPIDIGLLVAGGVSLARGAVGLAKAGLDAWMNRGAIITLDLVTGDAATDVLTQMGRPAWAKTAGGFVSWLMQTGKSGKTLSSAEADAVAAECKRLGVKVRLDPPHAGTDWDMPHLNVGSNGQAHIAVPPGYQNPGIPQGHP